MQVFLEVLFSVKKNGFELLCGKLIDFVKMRRKHEHSVPRHLGTGARNSHITLALSQQRERLSAIGALLVEGRRQLFDQLRISAKVFS